MSCIHNHKYHVLSLPDLDRDRAIDLILALHAPDQRLARQLEGHFRDRLGLSDVHARRSAESERASSVTAALANKADPDLFCLCIDEASGPTPIAMFGFRPLSEHRLAPRLERALARPEVADRYRGSHAIAHDIWILDQHVDCGALDAIFITTTRMALGGGFDHMFVSCSDPTLRAGWERFGIRRRAELRQAESTRDAIGVYHTFWPDNLLLASSLSSKLVSPQAA